MLIPILEIVLYLRIHCSPALTFSVQRVVLDHPWFPPRRILTRPRTGPGPAGAEIAEIVNTLIREENECRR
jgi:hypothetical protein